MSPPPPWSSSALSPSFGSGRQAAGGVLCQMASRIFLSTIPVALFIVEVGRLGLVGSGLRILSPLRSGQTIRFFLRSHFQGNWVAIKICWGLLLGLLQVLFLLPNEFPSKWTFWPLFGPLLMMLMNCPLAQHYLCTLNLLRMLDDVCFCCRRSSSVTV